MDGIVVTSGDGLNDTDVAMGTTGTEVATEAANMILSDKFATIANGVEEVWIKNKNFENRLTTRTCIIFNYDNYCNVMPQHCEMLQL